VVEKLYLFLPHPEALEEVYKSYGNQYAFFTALESTHLSKLLGEVRTRVRMTPAAGGGEVTYRDLSEGEQQLLLVLGLLKFTARDEALFDAFSRFSSIFKPLRAASDRPFPDDDDPGDRRKGPDRRGLATNRRNRMTKIITCSERAAPILPEGKQPKCPAYGQPQPGSPLPPSGQ
jgi:hypothetical protein